MPSRSLQLTINQLNESMQQNKPKKTIEFTSNKQAVFLNIIAFLMGRVAILHNLNPFGLGFFAALLLKDKKYGYVGVTALIGTISARGLSGGVPYAVSTGIIYLFLYFAVDIRKTRTLKAATITGLLHCIVLLLFSLTKTFYMYDLFMTVFESVVVFVIVYISINALPIALQKNNRKVLSTEEIICAAIIMALCLAGFTDTYILNLSIKNVLGIMLTLVFAFNGGAAQGATVGVTIGLITSMSLIRVPPVSIGLYAFAGMLAGTLKELGKLGAALGFILGNIILNFYINGYTEVFIQTREVVLAAIMFLMIPDAWMSYFSKFCNPVSSLMQTDQTHSQRMKGIMHEKISNFASTFEELASTFEEIVEGEDVFEQEDLGKLIEDVASHTCTDCGMKRNCWSRNFTSTFQNMNELLLTIETKGQVSMKDLPKEIKKRCIKPQDILEKMTHLYELSHLNLVWKKRMGEGRKLVGEQIKSVSQILKSLASDVNEDIRFDSDVENNLYIALDQAGLSVKKLMVSTNQKGNVEVMVEKNPCYNRESCNEKFLPTISKALGIDLIKKTAKSCYSHNEDEGCSFTLVEANHFGATTKVAKINKLGNDCSGDSYTFMNINENQYMMAISDGMGAGEKAFVQSNATITMLEKMMEAGFDREMAIKTINSMLILKSSKEMFSTVDMALIDMHQGNVDFIKIGTAPTYIRRKNGDVERISASSLPVGMLQDIEVQENSQKITSGDFIIMVSDGILEANNDNEVWIYNIITNAQTRNPQQLADDILKEALSFTGNDPEDDMTVMVTKIWETASI
ncbi:stage II sporulation protein E [Serpentinicella sp. ANB-PHB4]|uniref:stage II sporulation protein E n=1 Tax=Serpentinicella sp. ANB-PHB4 TaxID=3074076 RepID=UPI002863B430|nr:stage II sporulation protein E [Serpentinicella sp. ANB-PHB4]MDR5658778.1 stage II sporulation protein E [Serpentinicella sp. ANB-PHB4]